MLLELNGIHKTYIQGKMDVPVLNNISLSVASGDYVAIMGPSGSGKTTLMNIIGCLDYPTEGEYLLDGEDILSCNDTQLSDIRLHSIGFVFQNFYLLPRQSALENVALPLTYAGIKRPERLNIARMALTRVGLADRTDFKPTQLSGGQCQRVAIARAMVNNPKILLADEPTGALDTTSGKQIMALFQKLNDDGVTILMITHEQMVADHAKTIYHIRDGRFIEEGGHFVAPDVAPISTQVHDKPVPGKEQDVNVIQNEHVSNMTVQHPAPAVKPKHAAPAMRDKMPKPRKKTSASAINRSVAKPDVFNPAKPNDLNLAKPDVLKHVKPSASGSTKTVAPSKTDTSVSVDRSIITTQRAVRSKYSSDVHLRTGATQRTGKHIPVRCERTVPPIYVKDDAASAASKPGSDSQRGQFKNPIKTEILFDPSSWGTDQDEEEY